ncbi:hypothetical protein MTO96_046040, partial [Rhipicephalus appendiculatus]
HNRFTCSDPPEKGPCNETITRYYFNVQNKTCQEFVYGGCQGNANNYETNEECRVSCERLRLASDDSANPGRAPRTLATCAVGMPLEALMDGEFISPEEGAGSGWIQAHRKRMADKASTAQAASAKNGQHGTPADAKPPNPLRKLAATSRLPALPKTHFRVVIRPGGGLNVQACSQHKVFNALVMAAQLPPHATEEDIVCANAIQNIFVLSTPQETNALAYCTVQEIILTKQRHYVTTYLAPPGNTCRGVIRGVDADFTDADLQRMLRTDRNPKVLGARRIESTTTVIILFDGHKVPNYVYCGPIMYRCTLYKRQIDTCRNCGRVGHRQDVCPHPADKVCDQCGNGPPGPTHVCTSPKCALCGGAHLTGDRTCRSRYQVPYLVRRRRQRRRRRNKQRTTQAQPRDLPPRLPTSLQPQHYPSLST